MRATLLALTLLLAAGAARAEERVILRIENDGPAAISCVAVLAHFVTTDVGWIGPGDHRVLELEREPEAGTLARGAHKGEPMMLENVICGRVGEWEATKSDLPLLPVRRDPARALVARCATGGERLVCAVEPAGR